MIRRRCFLKTTGAGALGLALSPGSLLRPNEPTEATGSLVLVELAGGHDGLNMIVPLKEPQLSTLRPTLFLRGNQRIHLNESFALTTNLAPLHAFFQSRRMMILHNVGYLPTNRSHFHSMDVWHSGVVKGDNRKFGWLGGALRQHVKSKGKGHFNLFHLADGPVPLCLHGAPVPVTSLRSLDDLKLATSPRKLAHLLPRSGSSRDDLAFLTDATRTALRTVERLETRDKKGRHPSGTFPRDPFGRQMALVTRLAPMFSGHQIFFTRLGGFDTHSRQRESLPALHSSLARGLKALLDNLPPARGTKTTILVYSEFGRRVAENGSQGTDHGAAGPALVLGDDLNGGFVGKGPDLGNLMDGDLRPQIDFRNVYGNLLEDVLGIRSHGMKGDFGPKLRLFRRT